MKKKKTLNTFRDKFICGDCETVLQTILSSKSTIRMSLLLDL